jgi:CheY-like chemotaxis protein
VTSTAENDTDPLTTARIEIMGICDEMAIRLLDLARMLDRTGRTVEAKKMRDLAVENLQARIRIRRRLGKTTRRSQQEDRNLIQVLFVADTKADRRLKVLKQALQSLGCRTIVASGINNALGLLQCNEIRTVFCTLSVFRGTAFDLLSTAKARNLVSMPFVILTTSQTPSQDELLKKACTASGAAYMNLGRYDSQQELQCDLKSMMAIGK